MKPGFWDYIRAAFNARPIGMFVPPNWVGLGAVAILGLLNPGLWLVGAGLELGYLYTLASSRRFQNVVKGSMLSAVRQQSQSQVYRLLEQLGDEDRRKYQALEQRCQSILGQQHMGESPEQTQAQGEGLGRLLWIYLRLLLTRQSIVRVLRDSAAAANDREPIDKRIARLEERLKDPSLGEDLRKSLSGQVEILQQRLASQQEARQKLTFLEAELTRIQEQVELIREQAAFATDPAVVSQRIDQIAATLGGTTQWIREQQQIYGRVEDLLAEPPPVVMAQGQAARESA